jgi:hypothetical protein
MRRARSLRRKEAKRLRKQQASQRIERWNKTKKWLIWTVPASLAVLGALGSLATLHGYYKARLSISPETSSIDTNSLEMPIKVSNDGILSVNNVRFSCTYKDTLTAAGRQMKNVKIANFPTQNVAEIVPGHPITLFCPGSGPQALTTGEPFSHIELEINVSFRPSFYFWEKNDTFGLTGVRGPDGVFHWMPH